jgi:hypothetical protein
LRVKLGRSDFRYEKLRCGLHFSKTYSWSYNRIESSLSAIYGSKDSTVFSVFKIGSKSIKKVCEHQVLLESFSPFPDEAALGATSLCHLPKFLTLPYRIYTAYYNNTCLIIHQFYSTEGCEFSVSVCPGTFYMKYSIPGVPSSYPVCFVQFRYLIVIFIVGFFTLFVDISQPEVAECMFKDEFCKGQEKIPTAPIQLQNSFINLIDGKTMSISLDFVLGNISQITAKQWKSLINASVNLENVQNVVELINVVMKNEDADEIVMFVNDFFGYNYVEINENAPTPIIDEHFKSQIDYIAFNFPSIGGVLRKQVLYGIIERIKKTSNVDENEAVREAIEILVAQNSAMKVMRSAIDYWVKESKPPASLSLMINFACNCVCQRLNLPCWKVRTDSKSGSVLSNVTAACSRISGDDSLSSCKVSDDMDQSEASSSMFEIDAL